MTCIATSNQLINAYLALNPSQTRALIRATSHLTENTRFTDSEDLLQEALVRCLDGTRSWPVHIPLTVFLANAMKSIAYADRQRSASRMTRSENDWSASQDFPVNASQPMAPRSPEDLLIDSEEAAASKFRARAFHAALSDDPTAFSVLVGWLSGSSPDEIMRSLGLGKKEYTAARRRISRRVVAWNAAASRQGCGQSPAPSVEPPMRR